MKKRPGSDHLTDAEDFGTTQDQDRTGLKDKALIRRIIHRLYAVAAAALLVLSGLGWYELALRTDMTVCLDVNPSITLSVNRIGRVTRAEYNSTDAAAAIGSTSLRGKKTNDAVQIILMKMKEKGFLPQYDGTVLLSMDGVSSGRVQAGYTELSNLTDNYLRNDAGGGSLFGQTVSLAGDVRKYAMQYAVSPGKAALIRRITGEYPKLKEDYLASLSMSDLAYYLHTQNIDLRSYLEYKGTDLDEKWARQEIMHASEETGNDSEMADFVEPVEPDDLNEDVYPDEDVSPDDDVYPDDDAGLNDDADDSGIYDDVPDGNDRYDDADDGQNDAGDTSYSQPGNEEDNTQDVQENPYDDVPADVEYDEDDWEYADEDQGDTASDEDMDEDQEDVSDEDGDWEEEEYVE